MSNDKIRRWAVLLIPAALAFVLDQTSKSLVIGSLAPGDSMTPIPALSDFFAITFSRNTGAAFSILPQAGDIFLIIALIMTVGIVLFYRRIPAGHWVERVALGILLGGTMGNAADRIRFGFVVDWVHLRIPGLISNVSNFADHAIVIGIGVLFLSQWLAGSRKQHVEPDSSTPTIEGPGEQPGASNPHPDSG